MRKLLLIVSILTLVISPLQVLADEPVESNTEESFLGSLDVKVGLIDLPNGVAQLDVPDDFRYIGPADTQKFLEEGWGNPDGSGTLGMLLPVETDLFGSDGWGVVITYQEDGYVEDKDAAEIDYDDLLASMQEGEEEVNQERKKLGFEAVHLVGWAAKPHYDSTTKKLYWAKELKFGQEEEHTLNYNVRILGRKGVLVLNAVAAMPQLSVIEESMKQVLSFSEFKEGYRYSDYDSGVDKVAAYGIAALIGGKIAAKAGILAKLGAILFAFKKVIIVGLAAVGGLLLKLFGRKKTAEVPVTTKNPE